MDYDDNGGKELCYSVILLLFMCFVLSMMGSCVTTSQKLQPLVYYKRDITFKHEGKSYYGVGVLPYRKNYEIKVISHGALNSFSLLNCHVEEDTANPDGRYWKKGKTTIDYKPMIEQNMGCPLYVSAYNKKKKHGWGFLAFEHPQHILKSTMYCNGKRLKYNGVSVCATREGLSQRIVFDIPVMVGKGVQGRNKDTAKPCNVIKSTKGNDSGMIFNFDLSNRECTYIFISLDDGSTHKMHTLGHEDSIVRD